MINMITVDGATDGASRIAQLLERYVINVVEKNTLKLCADPARGQSVNMKIGLTGPVIDVHVDVAFMKLMSVVMMTPWKI